MIAVGLMHAVVAEVVIEGSVGIAGAELREGGSFPLVGLAAVVGEVAGPEPSL